MILTDAAQITKGTPIEIAYSTRPISILVKEFDSYKDRYARGRNLSGCWDFGKFIHINPATIKDK